ncbi:unnamed protein product, partial [Closterium sp. NIES-54]
KAVALALLLPLPLQQCHWGQSAARSVSALPPPAIPADPAALASPPSAPSTPTAPPTAPPLPLPSPSPPLAPCLPRPHLLTPPNAPPSRVA